MAQLTITYLRAQVVDFSVPFTASGIIKSLCICVLNLEKCMCVRVCVRVCLPVCLELCILNLEKCVCVCEGGHASLSHNVQLLVFFWALVDSGDIKTDLHTLIHTCQLFGFPLLQSKGTKGLHFNVTFAGIMVKNPSKNQSFFTFLMPFSAMLWGFILASFVATGFTLVLVTYLSHSPHKCSCTLCPWSKATDTSSDLQISEKLWFLLTTLLQQGSSFEPK